MEKGIHYKRMAKDSPGRGLSQLLLRWQPQKACDHMIAPQCLNSFFCGMCPYRFTVGVEEYNHFLGMPKPGLANRKLCGAVFYPDVSARQGTLLQSPPPTKHPDHILGSILFIRLPALINNLSLSTHHPPQRSRKMNRIIRPNLELGVICWINANLGE
jgi:hypothetical protein